MKDIYKLLSEKRKALERLQRDVDVLSVAVGLLSGDESEIDPRHPQSQPQIMVALLEANGKPLHVKEIAAGLEKKLKKKISKNNVSVILYRYAQRGKHFYKVVGQPNTYGLLKWRAIPNQQQKELDVVQ